MLNNSTNQNLDLIKSDSGYLGIFFHHGQQYLKRFDKQNQHHVQYELNPKIFAINEPYLMKTERESLLKLKSEIDQIRNEEHQNTSSSSTSSTTRKRKKSLEKKMALLDGNFDSHEEKSMAYELIKKYVKNIDLQVLNKREELLNLILSDSNSNNEAQTFVNSLFCNRFESLNYRTKLLCNPFYKAIKVKFGLSDFLIPPRCSFAGCDVIEGVKKMARYLKLASIEHNKNSNNDESSGNNSSPSSFICSRNPFVLIMDPAWDNNKSVKRRRVYETVSKDYLRRLCKETKILLDLILNLKKSHKIHTNQRNNNQNLTPSIVCAIWTTNLYKEFVLNELLPLLDMKSSFILKWHKVSKCGLPVKIHGGQEYLILAEKSHEIISSSCSSSNNTQHGVIVSIPSAIHSHKPSIMPIIHRLFNIPSTTDNSGSNQLSGPDALLHCSMPDPDPDSQTTTLEETTNHNNYWLVSDEYINPLCGIELFARYLHTGFHSIGYECIQLQNEKLFISTEVVE